MIGRFKVREEVFFGTFDGKCVHRDGTTYDLGDTTVLAPTCPSKIVCVGLNYNDHAHELDVEVPEKPVIFLKPSTSVIGPGESIVYPASSTHVDYEGELGVVIHQRCKNVANPAQVVLGYTCFNDVTARDFRGKTVSGLAQRASTLSRLSVRLLRPISIPGMPRS